MQRRHVVWLVVSVTAVSTSAVLIRAADDLGVPALTIAFYRCALASVVLLPLMWFGHRDELKALSPASRWLLLGSGLALGCHFAAWVSSLSYTSIAASSVLVQTMPVWVALARPPPAPPPPTPPPPPLLLAPAPTPPTPPASPRARLTHP